MLLVNPTVLLHEYIFFFYISSPDGKKIRSKPQLARHLGDVIDLSAFDFRTGRIIHSALRKSKRSKGSLFDFARGLYFFTSDYHLLNTCSVLESGGWTRSSLSLPVEDFYFGCPFTYDKYGLFFSNFILPLLHKNQSYQDW